MAAPPRQPCTLTFPPPYLSLVLTNNRYCVAQFLPNDNHRLKDITSCLVSSSSLPTLVLQYDHYLVHTKNIEHKIPARLHLLHVYAYAQTCGVKGLTLRLPDMEPSLPSVKSNNMSNQF